MGVLLYQFFTPGVHTFGPFFRCDIEEDVWLLELDHDNRKLVSAEQATVTVEGSGFYWFDSQDFDGSISVSSHPVPEECTVINAFWRSNNGWRIWSSLFENGLGPYIFLVNIMPYQNDTLFQCDVLFQDYTKSDLSGIAAETPEEALALYNAYHQSQAEQAGAAWTPYS